MHVIRTVTILLTVSSMLVSGWKSLMQRIPNGGRVPDPCNPENTWEGVGHLLPGGMGARNQFGIDFKTHSLSWTREMCQLDSDKDGRTNGEELGDPDCTWTQSSNQALKSTTITHPGICEPMDSPKCKKVNRWLQCEENTFNCSAINEPGIRNVSVTLPRTPVPSNKTTHYCMIFEFPQDGDFHIVATKPLLDNTKLMHHILVYGCAEDGMPEHPVNQPYECPLPFDRACKDLIGVWLLGSDGHCANKDAGFRIGKNGYKLGGLQVHWENQDGATDEKDGSGMIFYYTDKNDRQDSGILTVGQDYLIIPPGKEAHKETALCTSDCTRRKFSQNIHITYGFNHMHYLGKAMMIEHLRAGQVINTITEDLDFEYDSPRIFTHKDPIIVRPSDEIRTTCIFDSTSRNVTTRAGSGYLAEMCYGFLVFHPKQAVTAGKASCTAWKNVSFCEFELDKKVHGCEYQTVHDLENPATREIFNRVTEHCRPFGPCYEDCLNVVESVKKLPCFTGDIFEWARDKILTRNMTDASRNEWFRFYAGFDSCSKARKSSDLESGLFSSATTELAKAYMVVLLILIYTLT